MGGQHALADSALADSRKVEIFDELLDFIELQPTTLKRSVTLSPGTHPYYATHKMHYYLAALGLVKTEIDKYPAFTESSKSQFAEALDLDGGVLRLWNEFDVLLLDNNFSNAAQQQAIYDLLSVVPRDLHNTSSITMYVPIGYVPPFEFSEGYFPFRPQLGINIGEFDVAVGEENSFPMDGPVGLISPFMGVLAHELTHVIDAYTVQLDDRLNARRAMLLEDAGRESLNYLRSMFGDTKFQDEPQEFIASIGNQWFTDSEKTIQLGLTRFDNGRPDPINQALFMAEIFSQGANLTRFYVVDTQGNVSSQQIPLTRNGLGFIDSLIIGAIMYQFELDPQGRVTAYQLISLPPGDYNQNGTVDAADYIVWRDSLGEVGAGLLADGDNSGTIDGGDYAVWRAHFGRTAGAAISGFATVPEPSAVVPVLIVCAIVFCGRMRLRS
jgi:hypothetical protein